MFMAKVVGSIVATQKDQALSGRKLLVLRPMLVDESDPAQFRPGINTIVAVDSLGAGLGELVMFVQGSSARQAEGLKTLPIDAAVVGIVDSVDILGHKVFQARDRKS
jgi:ethanolamine utilization protein EutN